jgi:hypothetical protein
MRDARIELISRGFKIESITGRNLVIIKAEYIGEAKCHHRSYLSWSEFPAGRASRR